MKNTIILEIFQILFAICSNFQRANGKFFFILTLQTPNLFFYIFSSAGPLNSCILQIDSRLGLPPPPNAVVSAAATISTNLGVPPTADSRPALADTQVSVNSAFLRCMISHERGILMSERDHGHPPKICYFEIDDLNIEKPIDILDMTMLLNRMEGIKVQFQARIVDENAPIPYVANKNGVQILGDVPSYMHKIR